MKILRIDETAAETAIICISMIKSISKLFGINYASEFMPIETGWDSVQDIFFRAIDLCTDKLRRKFFESFDNEIIAIENDNMTVFYKDAYEFGELKGLPESQNPYLIDANKNMINTLHSIYNYSFDSCLLHNKRRKPRLMLLFSYNSGFYPNAQVIYELYEFMLFYEKMAPLLQSELRQLKKERIQQQIEMKKTTKRREAA